MNWLNFFQVLYTGTNEKVKNVQTEKVIDSVNDVMYATSHGRIKPGKHLSLALSIKSLTGSCKVIELINRLGHCSGYHIAENLETQFATEISARNRAMPDGMSNNQDLCTSLAWDNYDETIGTLSGKGTLHDTVGICYQNLSDLEGKNEQPKQVPIQGIPLTVAQAKFSQRTLKVETSQLEPYRKKPRRSSFMNTKSL